MILLSDHTTQPPTHRRVEGKERERLLALALKHPAHVFFYERGLSIRIDDGKFVRKPNVAFKLREG